MKTITEFSELRSFICGVPRNSFIAIEGFTGSGKSHLADTLSNELIAPVIHTDEFVIGDDKSLPYTDRLDYQRLHSEVESHKSSRVILFDGICARDSLNRLGIHANFFIYVKRVSCNGLWHDGFHLEDFQTEQAILENNQEPHLSDFRYHVIERPHENADIVFERIELISNS